MPSASERAARQRQLMHNNRPLTTLLGRRSFLALALASVPSLALANAMTLEPCHLKVTRLGLAG